MTRQSVARGFTLIEMLVVTGIIALISGLVLANNNRFGGQVLLQNLAYDMALSIRQAQVYGISVQSFQGNFAYAYGMHFVKSSPGVGSDYVLFADAVNVNGKYDDGELVQETSISQGYSVSDLCATPLPPAETEVCGLPSLDITFKRPEPDAYIRDAALTEYQSARIVIASPRGDLKSIVVSDNGQISVQ